MYSRHSDSGPRRPYGDRSSRQWDEFPPRREERHDSHRDSPRESYHRSAGGAGRGSPQRLYGKERRTTDRPLTTKAGPLSTRRLRRTASGTGGAPPRPDPPGRSLLTGAGRTRGGARGFCGSYGDGEERERSRGHSQDRPGSPYHSPKQIYETAREWTDGPPAAGLQEDVHQHATGLQNGSSGARPPAAAVEPPSSKGFQRFLDVLNKGVNVDVLTQIVTQAAPPLSDHQAPPPAAAPDRPRPPALAALSPEEQQKQRQMQGVLRAIGVDLGVEELGQMSHRIRQRLYGAPDNERGGRGGGAGARRAPNRHRSRSSSSSRSSFSPPPREPPGGGGAPPGGGGDRRAPAGGGPKQNSPSGKPPRPHAGPPSSRGARLPPPQPLSIRPGPAPPTSPSCSCPRSTRSRPPAPSPPSSRPPTSPPAPPRCSSCPTPNLRGPGRRRGRAAC
ncbi:uncharacterized protein ACNS7B_007089 [Menidia menidia]